MPNHSRWLLDPGCCCDHGAGGSDPTLWPASVPAQRQWTRVHCPSDSGLAQEQGVGSAYIQPGAPWEQAYIESFHDKLRDECLNREIFSSLLEARLVLEQWRVEYN